MTTEKKQQDATYKDQSPREHLEEATEHMKALQNNLPEIIKGLQRQANKESKAGPARKIDKDGNKEDAKKLRSLMSGAKKIQEDLGSAGISLPPEPEPPDKNKKSGFEDLLFPMGRPVGLGVIRGTEDLEIALAGASCIPVFVGEGEEAFRDPYDESGAGNTWDDQDVSGKPS